MKKKRTKRRGRFLIAIGMLLMIGGISLAGYNFWEGYQAETSSERILYQLDNVREENAQKRQQKHEEKPSDVQVNAVGEEAEETEEAPDPNRPMPAVEIEGYRYIGSIIIVPQELEFPVTEIWDYDRMKIATCRYSGSVYKDDLVICAHNYNNFFRKLDKLQKDDDVVFIDVEGNAYEYKVAETEVLVPTAIDEMKTGDWDLTLFTCNYMGDARVAVRCNKVVK